MSTKLPETEGVRHRWRWVFLTGLVLIIAGDQAYRAYEHGQLLAEKRQLHDQGYPTDLRELAGWQGPIPDDQNAALKILEAADYRTPTPNEFNSEHWPVHAEPLDDDLREALGEALTNNAPALEALHVAAGQTRSRFPIDYQRGANALLPHLAKIKSLTVLLRGKALVTADAGQTDQAVEAVLDSVALARSLDSEPLLISQLVRTACLSITCASLERLLTTREVPEAQLARLAAAFQGAREASAPAFRGGYVGEACFASYVFTAKTKELSQVLDQNDGPAAMTQVFFPLYAWTGLRDRDYRYYLHTMHGMIDSTKLAFPERLQAAAADSAANQRMVSEQPLLVFSRMLLPALGKSTEKAAELEARLRCAETALAVEQSRAQKNGAIPSSLTDVKISPGTAVDPMDGKPLRYKVLDRGYVVYSVGTDGTDDGGAERQRNPPKPRRSKQNGSSDGPVIKTPRSTSGTFDIPFSVAR